MSERYVQLDIEEDACVVYGDQTLVDGILFTGKATDSTYRALFKVAIPNENLEQLTAAKFCYDQLYPANRLRSRVDDTITLHTINTPWNANANGKANVPWTDTQSPEFYDETNILATARSKPGSNCVPVTPQDFFNAQHGVLLKGNENVSEGQESDHAIHGSSWRVPTDAAGRHRPYWYLTYSNTVGFDNELAASSNGGGSNGGGSNTGVIAGLVSALGIAIIAVIAFFVIRRRNRYDDISDSESEESEVEKDFIDTVGEAFGVVSSSLSETESEYGTSIGAASSDSETGFEVQSKRYSGMRRVKEEDSLDDYSRY